LRFSMIIDSTWLFHGRCVPISYPFYIMNALKNPPQWRVWCRKDWKHQESHCLHGQCRCLD
jgi:hypothetical protein